MGDENNETSGVHVQGWRAGLQILLGGFDSFHPCQYAGRREVNAEA